MTPSNSRLSMKLETGFDAEKAKPILKNISFSNINPSLTETVLGSIAQSLASLTEFPLHSVQLTQSAQIAV